MFAVSRVQGEGTHEVWGEERTLCSKGGGGKNVWVKLAYYVVWVYGNQKRELKSILAGWRRKKCESPRR